MEPTVSQAKYIALKSAYDATLVLLTVAANNRDESNRAMDSLREQVTNQAETIRQLRTELADHIEHSCQQAETIRQLRTELAETKQAMLLGVLSE